MFTGSCSTRKGSTAGICACTLYRWDELTFVGTHRNIEEKIRSRCNAWLVAEVPQEEADHHAFGFILDRRNTGIIHFRVRVADSAGQRGAICGVVRARRGITDAEARRILQNDPGKQQPRKFEDPDDHNQQ